MAAAQAVKEALWLALHCSFILKVGVMKTYCNIQGAIKLLETTHCLNQVQARKYHSSLCKRETVYCKDIVFECISTETMVADCFTKALLMGKFRFCISGMGVV